MSYEAKVAEFTDQLVKDKPELGREEAEKVVRRALDSFGVRHPAAE